MLKYVRVMIRSNWKCSHFASDKTIAEWKQVEFHRVATEVISAYGQSKHLIVPLSEFSRLCYYIFQINCFYPYIGHFGYRGRQFGQHFAQIVIST